MSEKIIYPSNENKNPEKELKNSFEGVFTDLYQEEKELGTLRTQVEEDDLFDDLKDLLETIKKSDSLAEVKELVGSLRYWGAQARNIGEEEALERQSLNNARVAAGKGQEIDLRIFSLNNTIGEIMPAVEKMQAEFLAVQSKGLEKGMPPEEFKGFLDIQSRLEENNTKLIEHKKEVEMLKREKINLGKYFLELKSRNNISIIREPFSLPSGTVLTPGVRINRADVEYLMKKGEETGFYPFKVVGQNHKSLLTNVDKNGGAMAIKVPVIGELVAQDGKKYKVIIALGEIV